MTRAPGAVPGDQPFDLTSVCFCKLTVGIFVFYDHFTKTAYPQKFKTAALDEVTPKS